MSKDEVLSNDPWQKLAKQSQVKKVDLDEALKKLQVTEEEAPTVKRQMMGQVRKLIKPAGTSSKPGK
ncbi:MAG TPA: hypothetical protein VH186_18375 [Chloroflexia bacterium]|nr:hypothetical protein [Chloroflexia bacterium]